MPYLLFERTVKILKTSFRVIPIWCRCRPFHEWQSEPTIRTSISRPECSELDPRRRQNFHSWKSLCGGQSFFPWILPWILKFQWLQGYGISYFPGGDRWRNFVIHVATPCSEARQVWRKLNKCPCLRIEEVTRPLKLTSTLFKHQ